MANDSRDPLPLYLRAHVCRCTYMHNIRANIRKNETKRVPNLIKSLCLSLREILSPRSSLLALRPPLPNPTIVQRNITRFALMSRQRSGNATDSKPKGREIFSTRVAVHRRLISPRPPLALPLPQADSPSTRSFFLFLFPFFFFSLLRARTFISATGYRATVVNLQIFADGN